MLVSTAYPVKTKHDQGELYEYTKQEKNKGQSIKTKLILIMTGLVIIPVITLTLVSMFIDIKQGKENADEINLAQAQLVCQELESVYNANLEALKEYASSPTTIAYLEGTLLGPEVEAGL